MRILLLGATGQLGKTIELTKPNNIQLFKVLRSEIDLLNQESCNEIIKKYNPEWIINCAAYTNVDNAEIQKEIALNINRDIPSNLAKSISEFGGKLLHISTDFVFNGEQNYPYEPYQIRAPINHYGFTKSQGEKSIEKILGNNNQAIIIRTSWLVSPFGNNFLLTILKLINQGKEISVVNDQIGCPTDTFGLSKACWRVITLNSIFDQKSIKNKLVPILHWSNCGSTSWYEFAIKINKYAYDIGLLKNYGSINPIDSANYPSKAKRPKYSLLNCEETYKMIKMKPKNWEESIKNLLEIINR